MSLNKLAQFHCGKVSPNKTAVQTRQRLCCGEFGASILRNRKGAQPCGPEYWRRAGGAKTARDELLTAAFRALAHTERGGVATKRQFSLNQTRPTMNENRARPVRL
jgi:hypothetical protein